MLHQNGCLSVSKIQSLFEDLFEAPLNEATIQECQRTAYERLEIEEAYIQQQLQQSERIHADETGVRCAGELFWLHELGNERFTYQFVHKRRGIEAHQEEQSLLLNFKAGSYTTAGHLILISRNANTLCATPTCCES
ncbi:MAG: transposase [Lewinellaceae bacterium]|nr:transposase [Lewinellaceae bacterium]